MFPADPDRHPLSRCFRQLLSLTPEQLDEPASDPLEATLADLIHIIRTGSDPANGRPVAAAKRRHRWFRWLWIGLLTVSFWGTAKPIRAASKGYNAPASLTSATGLVDSARGQRPDSVTVCATRQYTTRGLMTLLFGHHYRAVWSAPVRLPVLDVRREAGGLTPLEKGGGMQTLSLRLQGADGNQYDLRSINKNTKNLLPANFQHTLPAYILQDQISASHPYGALVVPPLAQAAGILHTTPHLVWIPADTALGPFRTTFGETVALLEERPESDARNIARFGGAHRIVNTRQVFAKCRQDHRHRVDGRAFVRARLFDMWLGDWDRHEDQWRWAAIETPAGVVYRPIPRDRDQVFARYDGLIPYLGTRKWGSRRFQSFNAQITDVVGLGFNARRVDRLFLTELTQADWEAVADSLQACLTDSLIEQAVRQWPDSVYQLHGESISAKLKSRRNGLRQTAIAYYRVLARQVTIVGTVGAEQVVVDHPDKHHTRVIMCSGDRGSSPTTPRYARTFDNRQTRNLTLYGWDGNDRFVLKGSGRKSPQLRVVGGPGSDTIRDESAGRGLLRRHRIYDSRQGTILSAGPQTVNRLADRPGVNHYDSLFEYDHVRPALAPGYNVDDGLFLGGGVAITHHGFRRQPVASTHVLTGNYAVRTGAYNFRYAGQFRRLIGPWDLALHAEIRAPNYVYNFYGLGNETLQADEDRLPVSLYRFYQLRFNQVLLDPALSRTLGRHGQLLLGASYQHTHVRPNTGRFTGAPDSGLTPDDFRAKQYVGLRAGYSLDRRDNPVLTRRGMRASVTLGGYRSLIDQKTFASVQGDVSGYWLLSRRTPLVLALRLGGGTNLGQFDFFQAQTLGGTTNLRGYRRTRFSGRSTLYQNTELRLRVVEFNSFLTRGYAGVLGFSDVGRVWADSEQSIRWHLGYGGGLWLAPFNLAVITLTGAISREGILPNLYVGFFF